MTNTDVTIEQLTAIISNLENEVKSLREERKNAKDDEKLSVINEIVSLAKEVGETRTSESLKDISMDMLFNNRMRFRNPTIVICTDKFWTALNSKYSDTSEYSSKYWGKEFIRMTYLKSNLVINLKKTL